MTKEDILRLRDTTEQTRVQFKERVTRDNKYDVSCEMVAQSNSRGGVIVVDVDDKIGRINSLSFMEVRFIPNNRQRKKTLILYGREDDKRGIAER